MNFTGRPTKRPLRLATEKLSQSLVRQAYHEALQTELPLYCPNYTELQRNRISAAMHDAGSSARGSVNRHRTSHWISESAERESRIREEQAGFRPGRGCIDQVLEQRHARRRPTIAVFLNFNSAFDSVDRSILFDILARNGVPTKYVNIFRALYSNTTSRVRVYGVLPDSFPTTSGVRQGCPISPFLFNFVVDSIMECSLAESHDVSVEVFPGERLVDLDYADDIVLLFDDAAMAQSTLNSLSRVVPLFGMHFAPSKCKVLLHDHQPFDAP
ncbi:unnamed protein product [Dicrocoelium dendriticum]|nr:unnamed protein product [Dicrocoelium dendriticum]